MIITILLQQYDELVADAIVKGFEVEIGAALPHLPGWGDWSRANGRRPFFKEFFVDIKLLILSR
jgi:hypothetical protein